MVASLKLISHIFKTHYRCVGYLPRCLSVFPLCDHHINGIVCSSYSLRERMIRCASLFNDKPPFYLNGEFKSNWHHKKFFASTDVIVWLFSIVPFMLLMALFGMETVYCEEADEAKYYVSNPPEENVLKRLEIKTLPNTRDRTTSVQISLKEAINLSRVYLRQKMMETGAPGLSISVSVDGKILWCEGLGCSDVENNSTVLPRSVMRIASISKSLTSVAVCQLIEAGKLDLDAPVQQYVPTFPKKVFNGEEVKITTRQLMNHTSGIRHYKLACETKTKEDDPKEEESTTRDEINSVLISETREAANATRLKLDEKIKNLQELLASKFQNKEKTKSKSKSKEEDEFSLLEYYIKEEFDSVKEALQLFQEDDLLFKPGDGCSYTTHGWTLVSAVVEGAAGKSFTEIMQNLFHDLGMTNTYLDKHEPIIYKRCRFYYRDEYGKLKNSPYVNNSYKWAGGGFLSTVVDLTTFGNAMLYSFQNITDKEPKGFLKASTMQQIWTPSPNTKLVWDSEGSFGLGWGVVEADERSKAFSHRRRFYASHTGGAIGASSVLLILPTWSHDTADEVLHDVILPKGVVVSIVTNMQSVGLNKTALSIAKLFERVGTDPKVVGNIGKNGVYRVHTVETS